VPLVHREARPGGSVRPLRLAAFLVMVSPLASEAEVAGVKLDERAKLGGSELVLNGAGVRKKLFFKAYVAGLYLTEKRKTPTEVFALDGPKRASVTLLRDLPAQGLVDALTQGISDNCSPAQEQTLRSRLDRLAANLLSFRQVQRGDVITVDWLPGTGTVVTLNGQARGEPIPGHDVYLALLRVWLGDRPTSAGLKKALLGQKD
jgi:hypothetical protein